MYFYNEWGDILVLWIPCSNKYLYTPVSVYSVCYPLYDKEDGFFFAKEIKTLDH